MEKVAQPYQPLDQAQAIGVTIVRCFYYLLLFNDVIGNGDIYFSMKALSKLFKIIKHPVSMEKMCVLWRVAHLILDILPTSALGMTMHSNRHR